MKRLNIIILELKMTVLGQWFREGKKKGIAFYSWNSILLFKGAIDRFRALTLLTCSSIINSNFISKEMEEIMTKHILKNKVWSTLRSSEMNVTSKETIYLLKWGEIEI